MFWSIEVGHKEGNGDVSQWKETKRMDQISKWQNDKLLYLVDSVARRLLNEAVSRQDQSNRKRFSSDKSSSKNRKRFWTNWSPNLLERLKISWQGIRKEEKGSLPTPLNSSLICFSDKYAEFKSKSVSCTFPFTGNFFLLPKTFRLRVLQLFASRRCQRKQGDASSSGEILVKNHVEISRAGVENMTCRATDLGSLKNWENLRLDLRTGDDQDSSDDDGN